MPDIKSRTPEHAIVVLTLCFALTWLQNTASIFIDRSNAGEAVVALNLDVPTDAVVMVELDIFSGRPNPDWRLPSPAQTRLIELFRATNTPTAVPSVPPGLGYRGMIVRIASGGQTAAFRAGDGIVEVRGIFYRDNGRAVEALLLDSMPAELKSQFSAVLPKLPR